MGDESPAGALIGCVCLVILAIIEGGIAMSRNASCTAASGTEANQVWDPLIPGWTISQYQFRFTTLFWNEVDVYNPVESNDTAIGYWVDMNFFMSMYQRFGYQNMDGTTLIEASVPFGLYFGRRFNLFRCDSAGPEFYIEEDYWSEPWFSFGTAKIFKIYNGLSDNVVAMSRHSASFFDWASFRASVRLGEDPNGEEIATLDQEWAGWFTQPKWIIHSNRPDMLPHSLISFLAAVYDIDRSNDD